MRHRRNGFTLVEILIVLGIVVLFITLTVPAIRVLTGSRSINMAENQIAALLTRAREEAVGIQDYRGVLFYVDPTTGDRVAGILVMAALIQDPTSYTTAGIRPSDTILLDVVPNRDSLILPAGVGLQTLFNGAMPSNSSHDRYMGFNAINNSLSGCKVGGLILFDSSGRLVTRQYGYQLNSATGQSTLAILFQIVAGNYNANNTQTGSAEFFPGFKASAPVSSQVGLVLFDLDSFKSQGYNDTDADLTANAYNSSSWTGGAAVGTQKESDEETWLDNNSTPIYVNRFNGTLIRGQ